MKIQPPKWADRFLEWYCNPDLLEEIQGDAYELFFRRVEEVGAAKAKGKFIWDTLRFFRWSNIKRPKTQNYSNNNAAMIKNYFTIGFRSLLRQKLPSFFNIFGLSTAIGCAIVAFMYLDWQYSLDDFHDNSANIYEIVSHVDKDGDSEPWADSPEPLGPALKADIPQIIASTRINTVGGVVKYEDEIFDEVVHFVDPDFMEMFSFPVLKGNEQSLKQKDAVIITDRMAQKYFGDEDPINQQISVTFSRSVRKTFFVKAVTKVTNQSSFVFRMLIPYDNLMDIDLKGYNDINDWSANTDAIFVQTVDKANAPEIASLMTDYKELHNKASDDWVIKHFELQPLETLSENSFRIRGSISFGNVPEGNLTLGVIAILLLLLACLNYMNIAIVSATKRLKEIGLRKVMGGNRGELIRQFLIENMLLCSFSLIAGVGLAWFLFLPGFNSQVPFTLPFQFSSNLTAVVFFGVLLLFTAVVSGGYPAFYISSFNPVSIFRGKEKFGNKSWLTKVFLTLQFLVAFMTIISGFIFSDAVSYFKAKDWGYNQDGIVVVPINGQKHYEVLKNKAMENPDIDLVSGAQWHIGINNRLTNIEIENENIRVSSLNIGFDYLETMGIRLAQGRFFDKNIESDKLGNVVVNKAFVKRMKWDNPIEKTIRVSDHNYIVVGVVEDFQGTDFYRAIHPTLMFIGPEKDFNYLATRSKTGNLESVNRFMEASWKEVEQEFPYEGFIQGEVFDAFFQGLDANIAIIRFVSILSLILSCMGLFGLVSFNVSRRMKEYSIRKVLGANLITITNSINNGFIWLLVIGVALGAPLGYLSINGLLTMMFPDPAPLGVLPFALGIFFVLLSALLTVASQVYKVAKSNPAEVLKNE